MQLSKTDRKNAFTRTLEASSVSSRSERGFTLIELLVVIAIIGILSSIILAAVGDARASARDSYRIRSLRSIQTALEMYHLDHGQYPTYTTSGTGGWRGGCSSVYGSYGHDSDGYIPGLVPEYITQLPKDPRCDETYDSPNGASFYYHSDGNNYVVLSGHSIETFDPDEEPHPLDRPGRDEQSLGVYSNVNQYSSEAGF